MQKNISNNPRTELNFFEQLNTGIEPRFRRGHPEPRLLHMKQSRHCDVSQARPAGAEPSVPSTAAAGTLQRLKSQCGISSRLCRPQSVKSKILPLRRKVSGAFFADALTRAAIEQMY